jgi:hypothetical protein
VQSSVIKQMHTAFSRRHGRADSTAGQQTCVPQDSGVPHHQPSASLAETNCVAGPACFRFIELGSDLIQRTKLLHSFFECAGILVVPLDEYDAEVDAAGDTGVSYLFTIIANAPLIEPLIEWIAGSVRSFLQAIQLLLCPWYPDCA